MKDREKREETGEYLGARREAGIADAQLPPSEKEQDEPSSGPQHRIDCGGERGEREYAAVQAIEPVGRGREKREHVDCIGARQAAAVGLDDHSPVGIDAFGFEAAANFGVRAKIDELHRPGGLSQSKEAHIAAAERAIPVVEDRHRHRQVSDCTA